MTFFDYNYIKFRYEIVHKYDVIMYIVAEKIKPDRAWLVPLSKKSDVSKNEQFYLYPLPVVDNFTEEMFEQSKINFIKFIKDEKVKEKLEKINKDFK